MARSYTPDLLSASNPPAQDSVNSSTLLTTGRPAHPVTSITDVAALDAELRLPPPRIQHCWLCAAVGYVALDDQQHGRGQRSAAFARRMPRAALHGSGRIERRRQDSVSGGLRRHP